MTVEFKDYYQVLGLNRNATEFEIKKAFRALARQYHPDVAKDKHTAEVRFKEINEANEVLSDPEKRRKYDALGANWNHPERQAPEPESGFEDRRGAGSEFHFEGTGFSDFFEQFFGRHESSFGGFTPSGNARNNGWNDHPVMQQGGDIEGDILVTLDEVLHGASRVIRLQRTDPQTRLSTQQTLRVKIPPGVREAQLIRLAGKGQDGIGGGEAGNLYLHVTYAKHPEFRVRGVDLYHDLELSPWEAVLGAKIHIPTLDGLVSLIIPAGTVAERQFRLTGKGLPAGGGRRGDLYAIVSIQVPSDLTAKQKLAWEQVAAQSTFNPRKSS
jgi:curved DNA-binding protein